VRDPNPDSYDVVILGGGLAGLTCALHCRKESPRARIAILEKRSHPVPEATHKVGESSVEAGAHYYAEVLGLKEHLERDQIRKRGLRLFLPAGDNSEIEKRLEIGSPVFPPTPSYQFDRGRFENYLAERCQKFGVSFLDSAAVKEIQLGKGRRNHWIRYARGQEERTIESRWVVDATGRAAFLKRKFGLQRESSHKNDSAWFRIGVRIKVDDWCEDADWQEGYSTENPRWDSTNHLLGEGYWVWLIPLASGSTSIGIVADPDLHPLSGYNTQEKALAWLDKHEPQCAEQVRKHQSEIQDFCAIKRYSMECQQVFSSHRWGIVGDAGYFIDPFYSPGNDFIAFGNTFVCELIKRDLLGKPNLGRTQLYNFLFNRFFHGTGHIFQMQYPLFGNPEVMPVKILWDWMLYWNLTAHVVCHDRIAEPMMYLRHIHHIKHLNRLNECMQEIFRQWHERTASSERVGGQINTGSIPLIVQTNESLQENLNDREFGARFTQNIAQMETLFWEIVDHAGIDVSVPIKRREHPRARKGSFREVFEELGKSGGEATEPTLSAVSARPAA